MSRHIQTSHPDSPKLNNQSQNGKLLLTKIHGKEMCLLLQNDVLTWAYVIPPAGSTMIGEIHIGKVKNLLKNIHAYFVEIGNGQICYLSFKDAAAAFVLNRKVAGKSTGDTANLQDSDSLPQLQAGDELPVQIIRDAIKTKPAAVTTMLELSSDYYVFRADGESMGISNKLDKRNTHRIKDLLKSLYDNQVPEIPSYSVIARTKCQELTDDRIREEYLNQQKKFAEIYRNAKYRTCFSRIHSIESPVLTAVRQIHPYEYDEIITDIPEWYETLVEANFISDSMDKNIRLYEDVDFSLTNLYGLKTKLENATEKKVWLKSGANLIIEQTECLTAIDVNSSKNIKGTISQDTVFQINMEAAKEVAVQIRLRNLSGIIVVDFINMADKEKEVSLLTYLSELTAKDPVTTRVVDMTPLGLVEITRKKVHMCLREQLNCK